MKFATCHPDKRHASLGLCRKCYRKLPHVKATAKAYMATPAQRKRVAEYEKGEVKAAAFRRCRHGFNAVDEARFKMATHCDWCDQPFYGEKPDIDHDHQCCPTMRHCHKCTRGFVHHRCNIGAIAYYEWFEKTFDITHNLLYDYRMRTSR